MCYSIIGFSKHLLEVKNAGSCFRSLPVDSESYGRLQRMCKSDFHLLSVKRNSHFLWFYIFATCGTLSTNQKEKQNQL